MSHIFHSQPAARESSTNEPEGSLSPTRTHPILPPAEELVLDRQLHQLDPSLPKPETQLNDTQHWQNSSVPQTFRARILDPRDADPQQLAEGYLDLLQDYNDVLNANISILLRCRRLAETNMHLRSGYRAFLQGLEDLYAATSPILEGDLNVREGPTASFTVIPVPDSVPGDIPDAEFGGRGHRSS
ncbi:hypothetical protein DFH09DRAFT_1159419 [Mycena vulgaris]|nr:hypothetical protein DFH09DRAFT_1219388 [Mycena vulgaris]KAJ6496814.1 hypothetical protein DFH09DRAFT_1205104 [Mycena vulgaris]KAJ6562693.1 hypothetical protein DFH09DRAFT_1159419 [Mycena vulgaris]